jgi:hypothetical protein
MKASEEKFQAATERYLSWLGTKVTLVPKEVEKRHKRLAESTPFEFLRATFYRWAQWWPEVCADLNHAAIPLVLGVGDLHAENFGTWRDTEGRLVWGVNDFDECSYLPYTNDLVRLAASARFAMEEQAILDLEDVKELPKKERKEAIKKHMKEFRAQEKVQQHVHEACSAACMAILGGYCDGLHIQFQDAEHKDSERSAGRGPFVLAEKHDWLREIVLNKLRERQEDGDEVKGQDAEDDFDEFFADMQALPYVNDIVPRSAWDALSQSMPEPGVSFRICKRDAGLGSLGRQRFTAVVDDWCGGILVREAKALAPSAWLWWDETRQDTTELLYQEALLHAVRARDPWMRLYLEPPKHSWVVRRLAPDSGKVKLKDLPKGGKLEEHLWRAMGREIANVHVLLGDVRADLVTRNENLAWLCQAANMMVDKIVEDWSTVYKPE